MSAAHTMWFILSRFAWLLRHVSDGANKKNRTPRLMYSSQICARIENGGLSTTTQPSG